MSHITYITFPVVTEDPLSQRKQNRLAKDAYDAFMVTVEPDDIGMIKPTDVVYDLPQPFGHTHYSDNDAGVHCNQSDNSCYHRCMDDVHPTDN